jgi:tetratricopeptide (TPR) repeat protein
MFRKSILASLCIIAFAFAAFAQSTAPVRGRVEITDANGKKVGVAGALIEVFRTDQKGNPPSATTDKKGGFSFAGLPLGGTFVLSVSGPGIAPELYPNVKAGREDILINAVVGDGKKWTEEEVRTALKNPASGGSQGAEGTSLSAADKKKIEEENKKIAELNAKNNKIKNADAIARTSFEESKKAYDAKNYELAISKVNEGIEAVPDFAGSTPIMLNLKGNILKDKGFDSYRLGAKSEPEVKAEKYESAKKDWSDSIEMYTRGIQVVDSALSGTSITSTISAEDKAQYTGTKLLLLSNRLEIYRLFVFSKIDQSRGKEALAAFQEYMSLESDLPKKTKAQYTIADILRESGDFESAVTEYRKVLEVSPDSPDALAGLGLCLFNNGVLSGDKASMQEGLNYMSKFVELAPETHPLKASVKAAVDYLKTEEKLAPQKLPKTAPATTKKKP